LRIFFLNLSRKFKSDEEQLLALSCLSVFPKGATQFPLDGFSLNLMFDDFFKIYRENSSLIKMYQE